MMMMVSIRTQTRGQSTHRVAICAAIIASLLLAAIFLLSLPSSRSGRRDMSSSSEEVSPRTAFKSKAITSTGITAKNREQLDEEDNVDPLKITSGSVSYGDKTLPYYHCGPLPTLDNADLTELVLLHGAAFTKEDWKTSGIIDMLCDIDNEEDEGNLSISALDLPVSADGKELGLAFDALVSSKIVSGRSATFVSPSASGMALTTLAQDKSELMRIVKAWIPVAPPAVLKADDSTLLQYKESKIPVLAIHGDKDAMGKKVTEKLSKLLDAEGIELSGRHPVYLDSPEEFVQEVMQFLAEEGL